MAVADQHKNQHHGSDDQNAGRFQRANTRWARLLRPLLVRRVGADRRHGAIVAPAGVQSSTRLGATQPGTGTAADAKLVAVSTASGGSARKVVRFGVFEADLAAGELRKHGARIRLQEQPFQVLAFLLERPGEAVTREELRQKLWPADTFVDFDHSLNTAMNKLREALGDSASSPRYVETLARRGYRFLVPVEPVGNLQAEPHAVRNQPDAVAEPAAAFDRELEVPVPSRRLTRSLFALIQVMYLSFYVCALLRLHEIDGIVGAFLPAWGAFIVAALVLVSAGVGIPLRCYLLSAVAFDHRRLGEKFLRMFLGILALDQLWAAAPLLLAAKIGFGAAFAATAALLYVPFSERTLIRMAYSRRS